MNTKIYLKTAIFAIAGLLTLGSCVKSDDYDTPEVTCSNNLGTVNHTLTELSALAKQNATSADVFTTDYVVEGYVSSTDVTGNIYKQLFIQDDPSNPTIGFEIDIDNSYLYTDWPVGAKVTINMKGLVTVKYNGVNKIGQFDATYQGAGQVGRINPTKLSKYMARQCGSDGFPILATMVPVEYSSFAEAIKTTNINKLIKIKGVQFNAPELKKNFIDVGGYASGYDRYIGDKTGGFVDLRISSYASFSSNAISNFKGSGDVTMVLSRYGTTSPVYQGYIRGLNDLSFAGSSFFSVGSLGGSSLVYNSTLAESFTSYATGNLDTPGYYNYAYIGNKYWAVTSYNSNKYLQLSSYASVANGGSTANTTYLIVPTSFSGSTKLSFKSNDGYYTGDALKVYYSTSYTAGSVVDPTSLIDITSNFTISKGNTSGYGSAFTSSGTYTFPTTVKGNGFIFFAYEGSPAITTTMQLDDISVTP